MHPNPNPNLNPTPNPIFGITYTQPSYYVPHGGAQAHAQSSWQQGPDPQAQSTWQQGPNPLTPSPWQQGPYPQAQPTWQQGPHAQAQSTWQQGPYQSPYPSTQSTWQQGPDPPAQSTWQQGPYPQAQSTRQQGPYQSLDPLAQSTWQPGYYQSPYPQAESTRQQGYYQSNFIIGDGSNSQTQSTWQSNPYPQSQSIIGSGSNSQTLSIPQALPSAPSEGDPSLQIQKKIPLARIKIDEERIPYNPKVIIRKVERVVDPDSESSSVCCACSQRIFSTPSITFSRGNEENLFLHEQCTTLPLQYLHELHLHHPIFLINHLLHPPLQPTEFTCHNCNQTCGTSFYQCPHPTCDY